MCPVTQHVCFSWHVLGISWLASLVPVSYFSNVSTWDSVVYSISTLDYFLSLNAGVCDGRWPLWRRAFLVLVSVRWCVTTFDTCSTLWDLCWSYMCSHMMRVGVCVWWIIEKREPEGEGEGERERERERKRERGKEREREKEGKVSFELQSQLCVATWLVVILTVDQVNLHRNIIRPWKFISSWHSSCVWMYVHVVVHIHLYVYKKWNACTCTLYNQWFPNQ